MTPGPFASAGADTLGCDGLPLFCGLSGPGALAASWAFSRQERFAVDQKQVSGDISGITRILTIRLRNAE